MLGVKPTFAFGFPVSFIEQWHVEYYKRSGAFNGVAIDPENPRLFGSEASYLDRHDLFLPGKKLDWEAECVTA